MKARSTEQRRWRAFSIAGLFILVMMLAPPCFGEEAGAKIAAGPAAPGTGLNLAEAGYEAVSETIDRSPQKGFWGMLSEFEAEEFVARYGYAPAFVATFILGMGLTLTPCVYPIIPITVGYFGTQSGGRWTKQLALASVFGAGVAVSYASIGTIAALSGSMFGTAMQSVWVLISLATLCFVMGLNAFGVFELRLPGRLMKLAAGGSTRRGAVGAALMGLTMGIAGASCLAAFIVSLLAFVGQRGNPVLGFAVFLTLGLGFATPFVFLATFSGLLHQLPRSGEWLVYAKKVMGSLLFAAALYFLRTLVHPAVFRLIVFVALSAAALYFGFFENTPVSTKTFRTVRIGIGAVFLVAALWATVLEGKAEPGERIAWQPYSEEAVQRATQAGRPVIIDVYADWCIACEEMERLTLRDPRLVEASRDFVMLKADMTRPAPEWVSFTFRYDVWGFPTMIFLGPDGRERPELRVVQFEGPQRIVSRMKALKQTMNAE